MNCNVSLNKNVIRRYYRYELIPVLQTHNIREQVHCICIPITHNTPAPEFLYISLYMFELQEKILVTWLLQLSTFPLKIFTLSLPTGLQTHRAAIVPLLFNVTIVTPYISPHNRTREIVFTRMCKQSAIIVLCRGKYNIGDIKAASKQQARLGVR